MPKTSELAIEASEVVFNLKQDSNFSNPSWDSNSIDHDLKYDQDKINSKAERHVLLNFRRFNSGQMFTTIGSTFVGDSTAEIKVNFIPSAKPIVKDHVITGYEFTLNNSGKQAVATDDLAAHTETLCRINVDKNAINVELVKSAANNCTQLIIDPKKRKILTDHTKAKAGDIVLLISNELFNHLSPTTNEYKNNEKYKSLTPTTNDNGDNNALPREHFVKIALTKALKNHFKANMIPSVMDYVRFLNELALRNIIMLRSTKIKSSGEDRQIDEFPLWNALNNISEKHEKISQYFPKLKPLVQAAHSLLTNLQNKVLQNNKELQNYTLKDFLNDFNNADWAKQHQIDINSNENTYIKLYLEELTKVLANYGFVENSKLTPKFLIKVFETYLHVKNLQSGTDGAICAAIIPDHLVEQLRAWLEHPTQRTALLQQIRNLNLSEEAIDSAIDKLEQEHSTYLPGNGESLTNPHYNIQPYPEKVIDFLKAELVPQVIKNSTTSVTEQTTDANADFYQNAEKTYTEIEQRREDILKELEKIAALSEVGYFDIYTWEAGGFDPKELKKIREKIQRSQHTSLSKETQRSDSKDEGLILTEIDHDVLICTSDKQLKAILQQLTDELALLQDTYQVKKAANDLLNDIKNTYTKEISKNWNVPASIKESAEVVGLAAQIYSANKLNNPLLNKLVSVIRLELENAIKANPNIAIQSECTTHQETIKNAKALLAEPTGGHQFILCKWHLDELAKTKRPSYYALAQYIIGITLVASLIALAFFSVGDPLNFGNYISMQFTRTTAGVAAGSMLLLYYKCKLPDTGTTQAFRTFIKDVEAAAKDSKQVSTDNSGQSKEEDTELNASKQIKATTNRQTNKL